MKPESLKELFQKAADYIGNADSLLITAGAGMGVDSGLPDFRGTDGFWKAYPVLGKQGVKFEEIADPINFISDPKTAWGFYGHRLNLYRETEPHLGFKLLKTLGESMLKDYFVYTSNVDGQFQKAGFPLNKIQECHGSIHYLQCSELKSETKCNTIWSAEELVMTTDDIHCKSTSELPKCKHCGSVARPNILMFNDFAWLHKRNSNQKYRYNEFLKLADNLVIIEIGAGTAIPSVREQGEYQSAPIIRINPRESELGEIEGVSIPTGALEAIKGIIEAVTEKQKAQDPFEANIITRQIDINLECRAYQNKTFPFKVKLFAGAISDLISDARNGYRIYELFNITRPGDILKYVTVELIDVLDVVRSRYMSAIKPNEWGSKVDWPENFIPLNKFDTFFFRTWDEEPEDECWLNLRESNLFKRMAKKCFNVITDAKTLINKQHDPLIQHQIMLLNNKDNLNDYLAESPFQLTWQDYQSWTKPKHSASYYKKLIEIIKNKEIKSVAYRHSADYQTIRLLATEQRIRADKQGISPIKAFEINVSDDVHEDLLEWDAPIFWYSEGLGPGDLLIEQKGNLNMGVRELLGRRGSYTNYIFMLEYIGELENYSKETSDDWVFYQKISGVKQHFYTKSWDELF